MQYGAPPVVRLLTRRVSDSAPLLRRHLVREASIPTSSEHGKQLSLQTVAVLEFDCRVQQADSTFVYDRDGWTNGNVQSVVTEIEDKYRHYLHHADGNDVREGVRKLLEQLHRVGLRGTGACTSCPVTTGPSRSCKRCAPISVACRSGKWANCARPAMSCGCTAKKRRI